MIYSKYIGSNSQVILPDCQDSQPITGIGAKAFLSCKDILSLTLPATVTGIGDWAFAHMQHLQELTLPANGITFGKQVFLGCDALKCIHITPDTSSNPGLPYFLASAVTVFSSTRLLDPVRAASRDSHPAWMRDYDSQLLAYLMEDDLTGYEPVFYGWFNDEDADITQKPQYIRKQRRNKVYLTFQRLYYDAFLSPEHRSVLQSYLRDHMPWGRLASEHTAVWDLLPEEYAADVTCYPILEQAGALPPENIPRLVEHLSQADPEVIAWLLRLREQHQNFSDFFDNFSL